MPLNEHRVELTAKRLIACRECHAIADVSMTNSHIKLVSVTNRWEVGRQGENIRGRC